MIMIPINENDKKNCYEHSLSRIKYEYNRFNFTLEQRISMILIGTLGQNIFKSFLIQSSINFEYEYQAGYYDDFDFRIGKKIIEIKTSGYNKKFEKLNLLYTESQLNRGFFKNYNYCVLIFVNGYDKSTRLLNLDECNQGIIAGYIPFSKIKDYKGERKFFGDDYKIRLNQLTSIDEFKSINFTS